MELEKVFEDLPMLETERLSLRKLSLDDAEVIFEFASDAKVFDPPQKSVEDSVKLIKRFLDEYEKRSTLPWVVIHKKDERVIGDAGFIQFREDNKRAEIMYVLHHGYWNKGFATELTKGLIRFGFGELGLCRIQAICETANTASARVMEKAGMKFEGVLRNYIQHNDKPLDMKIYSIIRPDFVDCGL